jgi:hypothetical protein
MVTQCSRIRCYEDQRIPQKCVRAIVVIILFVLIFVLIFFLAMLSSAQAIIAAEAGVIAKAENMAAVIKIFFIGTSLEMKPAYCWLSRYVFASGAFLQPRHFCVQRCSGKDAVRPFFCQDHRQ